MFLNLKVKVMYIVLYIHLEWDGVSQLVEISSFVELG